MKLFIGNKYNLKLYTIPEEIEDSYLIKYHSSIDNEDKNIIITNKNDKLVINNNLNLNLFDDNKTKETIELEKHKNYKLFINDTEEELLLYCLPNEIEYKDYAVKKDRIKIGQGPGNEIVLKDNLLKTYNIEIIKIENEWFVKSDKIPFYVNKSTTNYSKFEYGDELFVAGLKIIWLKGFIRVSLIPNVSILIPEYDIREFYDIYKKPVKLQELEQKNNYEEVEEEEETETITLENPPLKEKNNDLYYFIALGSSFTLAITSVATLLTIFLAIASGSSTIKEEKNLLIISIGLILCAIIFPFLIKFFQNSSNDRKEGKRILQYSEYLKSQKGIIANAINQRANKLKRLYPSSEEWQKRVLDGKLWPRTISSPSFLTIRFGSGDISANIAIDSHKLSFTYENPILKEQLMDIQNSSLIMKKVPIPISLLDNKYLPVIVNENKYKAYIDMLLLQLISFHNSTNLKLIFFVSEENHNVWDNYKYIPHVYDEQNEIRFFAYDKNDTSNIINYLEETYQNRIQKLKNSSISDDNNYYSSFNDYYLIITDRIQELNNYEIINKIKGDNNYGFSLLSFEKNVQKKYIDYKSYLEVKEDIIVCNNIKSNLVIPKSFIPDFTKKINIYNITKTIANLPVISYNNKIALPKEISLLDVYKVGEIEQLNILDRWSNNNTVLSLGAPIGVTTNNEVVELNLHEKHQGPHALIGGMVGSGKLELLKTYITSMCINYSPEEVQFIIVDYKNGGLVKTFHSHTKEMPHIVGSLTELNHSEIYRLFSALKTEINRRKEVFTAIQTKLAETSMNIYKYNKLFNEGAVTEPISHLFIVFYEYFELFNQYSDEFNELLNLIYSANSVGLHLILCTQKPGEVLNTQIISNSHLKICLKVQSLNDSEEVLKRREAASISNPGRFYYEVGYNESFKQVQCAYSSSLYNPREVYKEKIDDNLSFITDSGIIYKEINEDKVIINNRYGNELDNIRDYINELTSDKIRIVEDLLLPSLSENLSLSKLIRKYKYKTTNFQYNAIVGEYDNPIKKEQNIFTINLDESNNIIIQGLPGTGKASQMSTILFSICLFHSPKEVNIYVLDNNDEKLKSIGKMPQVGEYTSGYDKEKVETLLTMLNKEIKKRKTTIKGYNSFSDYNTRSSYKIPLILIAIRDYKNFVLNNPDLEDKYNELLREGPNLGIVFITSITEGKTLLNATISNFRTILGTQFPDPFDYRYILDAPKGLIPKNCFGRGLAKINGEVVEYQTAFIASREETEKVVLENAVELKNNYKTKVKPILVKLMTGGKKDEK